MTHNFRPWLMVLVRGIWLSVKTPRVLFGFYHGGKWAIIKSQIIILILLWEQDNFFWCFFQTGIYIYLKPAPKWQFCAETNAKDYLNAIRMSYVMKNTSTLCIMLICKIWAFYVIRQHHAMDWTTISMVALFQAYKIRLTAYIKKCNLMIMLYSVMSDCCNLPECSLHCPPQLAL